MASKFHLAAGYSRTRSSALVALAFLLTATAAHAGFEWVPSSKKSAAPVEAAPEASGNVLPMPPSSDVLLPETAPQAAAPKPVESQPLPTAQSEQPAIKVKRFGTDAASPAALHQKEPQTLAVPPQMHRLDAAPPMPMPSPAPAPVTTEQVRKVILSDDAPETARTSVSGGETLSSGAAAPAEIAPPQPQPAPAAAQPRPKAEKFEEFGKIEGFGTDIPLALALREIVPADYAYAFGDGVNPGYRISWTGGKSWLDVVRDMIAPLGLIASIQGNVVVISNANAAAPPASALRPDEKRSEAAPPETATDKTTIYSLRRQAITNPGEDSANQPPETLQMIEEVVASEMPESVPAPEAGAPDLMAENAGKSTFWEARKGDSLKRTLGEWGKKANFELVWESSHDYTVSADVLMNGDVQRALSTVIASGASGEAPPQFTFVNAKAPGEQGKLIVQDKSRS